MTSHFFLTSFAPHPIIPFGVASPPEVFIGEVFMEDEQLPVDSDCCESVVVWYCFNDDHRRERFALLFLSHSIVLTSIGSLTPWCCFWWKEKRLLIRRFGGVDCVSDENERSSENDDIVSVEQFGNLGLFICLSRFPFWKFINTDLFQLCCRKKSVNKNLDKC